jgi:hypothetical protein
MIVIHIDSQQDTSFLKKTYEGIDNLNLLYNPTKEQVNKTLEENPNEDVMMLGHGSPSGLFSYDWNDGDVIGAANAHLLKGRNCIGIWCWAKKFAKNYGLKGYFTSMFISNKGEARAFGYNATEKEVFNEVELFSDRINKLIKDNVPYEEWVGKLQGIADMSKPFVKYNYEGMEYFDGTQKADFAEGTFGFLTDTEEDVERKDDDEVDMWFEDYCYENGIEGDWAKEIAYPIFVAGWNSHRYAEQI